MLTAHLWLSHFVHLVSQAFVRWYTFPGTSPGGVVAQVVILFATEVQGGWWKVETWRGWRTNWVGGLRRAAYALGTVWLFVFVVCVFATVYDEHQNLSGRLRAVVNEREGLKRDFAARDENIRRLTDENNTLKKRPTRPGASDAKVPLDIMCEHLADCPASELKRRTLDLAAKIDRTYFDYEKEKSELGAEWRSDSNPEAANVRANFDLRNRAAADRALYKYSQEYRGDALKYREELLKRVGPGLHNTSMDYEYSPPAGFVQFLHDIAEELRKLAANLD